MKFTLSWLREHLATEAPLTEIVTALTRIGLEVERVDDPAAALKPFSIARVVTAEQHPNADRLRVLTVDPGDGSSVQVVCGAPNARAGLVGVFARPGSYIPGTAVQLETGTIRGVESRGMMLSEREMGLSDEHDGIVDLPADAPVGTPYVEWARLDDPVIEIAVTPNRADCLGIRGIARDLAAAGLGSLKPLDTSPVPAAPGGAAAPEVVLHFPEGDPLCPAFALRLIEGVENGPSPDWLKRRLTAIGLRPINRLVDVTNYITYALNRPLHVFDADKVAGSLVVRRARAGETVEALDGRTYTLDPSMCVIADDNGIESLAGIMGGEASGSTDGTTRVLVESALWEPLNIARTGRTLGINTDARHRFERGVDPQFMVPGLEVATRMILDLCGGRPGPVTVAGEAPGGTRTITYPPTEVKRLSGMDVAEKRQAALLQALGFTVDRGAKWQVTTPSWRGDVEGKADIVEEVVRIVGIDDVPAVPLARHFPVAPKVLTPLQTRVTTARRALAARGMVEAVTWSFIGHDDALAFGGGAPAVALANPIAETLSDMRPSLLPGLVRAVTRNVNRGHPDLALFEVGQVFAGDEPADQTTVAAGVRQGLSRVAGAGRHWSDQAEPAGVFDAKADLLAVLAAVGGPANAEVSRDAPAWYHPGRSGTLRLGPKVLGHFGELHPRVLAAMDAPERLVAFELTLDAIPLPRRKGTTKPAYAASDLQPVRRDFAFLVDEAVDARTLVKAARGAAKALVTDVAVFDVYRGPGVPEGQKSIAVEATLQPTERTMTDKEIDEVSAQIVAAVGKATGATLRG
jgi:phenylalanyl-tRNA synthetase beta chain